RLARTFSGSPWEDRYGYCRALRAGGLIFLTGTAPVAPDGSTHAPGDAHAQTLRCFEIIEEALRRLGADRTAIVRSRLYVTDIGRADEFGLAHRAFFGDHRPCATMVGVSALIRPDMLIEVECDAVAPA
ncbi:MAG TPA: RidA family protein, partial [Phycisphaerales bacterium]|nr:RidA family protein [Phycisphaerales bacterium]